MNKVCVWLGGHVMVVGVDDVCGFVCVDMFGVVVVGVDDACGFFGCVWMCLGWWWVWMMFVEVFMDIVFVDMFAIVVVGVDSVCGHVYGCVWGGWWLWMWCVLMCLGVVCGYEWMCVDVFGVGL